MQRGEKRGREKSMGGSVGASALSPSRYKIFSDTCVREKKKRFNTSSFFECLQAKKVRFRGTRETREREGAGVREAIGPPCG